MTLKFPDAIHIQPGLSGGGGGGGTTQIAWKYPEMAMFLADKDKFDLIEWNNIDQSAMVQNFSDFTESILVGINECNIIFSDTFFQDMSTTGQANLDLNKDSQRIATVTISQSGITFSNLAGALSGKNIQNIILGHENVEAGQQRGIGINTSAEHFSLALILIYMRDYMNNENQ